MKISLLFLFLMMFACASDNAKVTEHEQLLNDVISQTIGPVLLTHDDKLVGVYWTGKILDGHYRKKFIEIKSDSFPLLKNVDADNFAELIKVLQDTVPINFNDGDKIGGLMFLKELPGEDAIDNYFIVEGGASKPVIKGNTALIYIELMDIFYHDGDGLICELEFRNNKWNVDRVTTAWSMRMDTLKMGVFH